MKKVLINNLPSITAFRREITVAHTDQLAILVRSDQVLLFAKTWKAVKRCQYLLIVGLCLATIFGTTIYLAGKKNILKVGLHTRFFMRFGCDDFLCSFVLGVTAKNREESVETDSKLQVGTTFYSV